MLDKNKKYWLSIENWVYVSTTMATILLYNTRNGQYIINDIKKNIDIIKQLHEKTALGVIMLDNNLINEKDIYCFIKEGIQKEILTITEQNEQKIKPIRLMPILNIQRSAEKLNGEDDRSIGENALYYLKELTIHINDNCNLSCSYCAKANKQFHCCSKNNNLELSENILHSIAKQIKYAPISKLNIIGGDILSYPLLEKIPEIFKEKKDNIHFWSNYKNFSNSTLPIVWDILIDFPINEQILSKLISNNKEKETQYNYHFIVQGINEVNFVEEITNNFEIQNFEIHPYYNGGNIDFFETCVFLNEEDILSNVVSQRRIFCNQALNTNFFGGITILSNGDVTANINTPVLGNIISTSLLELITQELERNTAWRKIRSLYPCNDCLYQFLCPPISNYEMILEKNNLCKLSDYI
ncbi:TIGR04150 pseudo-rSAM protein [Bacteroidales bacterium OttesenSCG-928-K22]|nr:TIGR04150 pseudo-rSAM protein [Bacteroidales bacterium OttesenSCG-928-L14]MDL2240204.1 TIGR04150 pseudo-rSAM protein [Bacteroidales bacterium OttesenSCG-928-K22]